MSPAGKRLHGEVQGVRSHLRKRGAIALSVWLAAVVGLALIAAWMLAGPEGWRQGSDVPAQLDAVVLALALAALWAHRAGAMRWLAEAPLSETMERAAGLRPGIVRGTLELSREIPPGVSRSLAARAAERALAGLSERSPAVLSGELGAALDVWTRRGLTAFSVLAVLAIGLAVATPSRSLGAWAGLSSPFGLMKDPVLPSIVVTPGNVEVLRGSDVGLTIEAPGRATVLLSWQAAGDIARNERLELTRERASHVFEAIASPIEYRVQGDDGSETETYSIIPIDPLFVSDFVLGVVYPAHTGLLPDEYRGDPPPLRLPSGSRLTLEGRASRPLSRAALEDSTGATAIELQVEGSGFQGAWTPRADGVFTWSFQDDDGDPAEIQPGPLVITLVPDSAPHVAIPLPGRDTILPLNLRQPLILEASDDYGLRRLELVAYRVTAFGERHEPITQGLDLGGTRAALARPLLDLRSWGLLPGDTVRYYARAIDNAPSGQVASTREYVLRMPAAAEMQRAAEQQLEDVADRLAELAEEAARRAEENRDQALQNAAQGDARGAREEGQPEFEQREELQAALDNQEEMSTAADSLRAELGELERMLEDAGQADPELSRELEELQELLRELTGSDLRQRMEEMAEALDQDDLRRANESLSDLAEQQEEFRKRLEQAVERFRRAAVEQDFRATTGEAEELARQEEALADAMKEEDNPELRGEQQQDLEARAEQLQSQMERLEQRLGQIDEQEAAAGVQQARESMRQAQQQMQQAEQQANQGQNQQAAEQADGAAERLQQVAQELQQAQEQMAEERAEAAQAALHQAADDALSLARRQTELRERMRGSSQEQVAGMRSDEASLLQGVENMAENLQAAGQGAMEANQQLSAHLGRAMESIEKTIEAMQTRRGSTPSPHAQAGQAIGDLNQLALAAIAGAEGMGQQGEGQSGDVAQQLEQLAQEQGDLMNQTGQLMPLELGEQAMQRQLQELSQGQQSVASDLGELADQPGAEESLGDLEQLAAEAEALAEQLAQGRLTPEITQRQERLFHRLLDAGRSLEREESSDERESETPGVFERGEIMALTADQLGLLRFRLPDAAQLQRLSPAVRQLVIQYFERLNRGGGGGGGGSGGSGGGGS